MNVGADSFNVLSLCTGAGMLDTGVRVAIPSARLVCCVEWESYATGLLASRMEEKALDDAPIWTNLRTFDGRPWRGIVDLVIAGYPCPPFSQAGKRLGAADPRHLWPEVARVVREVEPGFVFLENVSGHLSLGFDEVARDLEQMGYRVTPGVFSAEEVGAPHQRERLFILAHAVRDDRDGQDREGRERRRASYAGPELVNTSCQRRGPRAGHVSAGRDAAEATGDALAHAKDADGRRGECGEEEGTRPGRCGRRGSPGRCGDMADTEPEGLQGLRPEDAPGGGASLSHYAEKGERIHSSRQVPVISTHGAELSKTEVQTSERRRLNPAFVCWLMGWPWWWTRADEINFAQAETELYLSRLRSRLSSLLEKLD